MAEASTTTVRTVIHGSSAASGSGGSGEGVAGQDAAAALIEGFEGTALDAQAEAEIGAALLALAARQRELDAAVDGDEYGAVAMQIDDPGVPLVQLGERDSPYYGPLQMHLGLVDADTDAGAVQRIGGEASWVAAGADVPEVYREWVAAAEAEGRPVPVVPLTPPVDDGIAAVRKPPSRWRARKAKAAGGAGAEETDGEGEAA